MEKVIAFVLFLPFLAGLFFFFSWLLMLTLGALLPTFGLATVSFWQAAGLKLAAMLLFPTTSMARSNSA